MSAPNPVLPGYHADPSVVRVGSTYYLTTSTNEYAPGLPIYASEDLVSWRQIGSAVVGASSLQDAPSSLGLFAPTLRHDGERFVLLSTLVGTGHFVMTATDAAGPWSAPIFLDGEGWDPSLVFHDSRAFLTWSTGHAVRLRELDPRTWKTIGDEYELWRGTGGDAPEGPHLYFEGGWWILLIAEGGTGPGHAITLARSRQIAGPYTSFAGNPVLTHRGLSHPFQCVGHADLVQATDGRWWAVLLATRPTGGYGWQLLGRETFVAPVEWVDGWPLIGTDGRIPLETGLDGEPTTLEHLDPLSGSTHVDERDPGWLALRDPTTPWLSPAPGGGFALTGMPLTLDGVGSPAFLGRRQGAFGWQVAVTVDTAITAGLAVRRDERHHYELVVAPRESGRVAEVRARIGDLSQTLASVGIPDGPVRLVVDVTANRVTDPVGAPGHYRFTVAGQAESIELAALDARYLSTEVAGGFTGVVIGMYATGDGTDAASAAVFTDWHSRPVPDAETEQANSLLSVGN